MTQFETELIRAIEHGCPFCGWNEVDVKCYVSMWIHRIGDVAGNFLMSAQKNHLDRADRIICGNNICRKEFWTWRGGTVSGWITELQEIVKGE